MEILLTVEQEAQLSRLASHEGKPVGELLTDCAYSECAYSAWRENDRFLAEVDEESAGPGREESLEEDEMDARVEAML